MSDNYWTTSQVADYLACDPTDVYESRRRKEWPGVLGKRRGRQLLFEREAIKQGLERLSDGLEPIPQETTENPTEAILWALEGIHTTLRAIHNELRAQRGQLEDHYSVTVNASGVNDEDAIQAAVALTEGTFWIGKPIEMGDEEE